MTSARAGHRHLPTLTEVVQGLPVARADGAGVEEELADRIVRQVTPLVDARMRTAVQTLAQAQVDLLLPQLRREIEEAVRTAVEQALMRERSTGP